MNRFLVYLLAAGLGRRAGGPKAWMDFGGKPMLKRHLEFLIPRFAPQSLAVSVQEPWKDRCWSMNAQVRWVSVDPAATALGSLQELVRTTPLSRWAYVFHVDMPVWNEELFYTLASCMPKDGAEACEAIVPMHGGRGGHPIMISPALQEPLLALDPAANRLDSFLHTRRVLRREVPYACVLENWNEGAHG